MILVIHLIFIVMSLHKFVEKAHLIGKLLAIKVN